MFTKEQKRVFIYIIIILIIGIGVTLYRNQFKTLSSDYIESNENFSKEIHKFSPTHNVSHQNRHETIFIHIAGSVYKPGYYKIKKGLRGFDAILIAGGLRPNANIDKVNLAVKLKDGQKIYIPEKKVKNKSKKTKKDTSIKPLYRSSLADKIAKNNLEKIDINTASESQLILIPGIGPSTAKRILETRKKLGKFHNIQDLLKVKGIGPNKLKRIKLYLGKPRT